VRLIAPFSPIIHSSFAQRSGYLGDWRFNQQRNYKLSSRGLLCLLVLFPSKELSALFTQTMFLFMSDERFSLNPYFAYNFDNRKQNKGRIDETNIC
jgi:hypothetical protein